MDLLGVQLVGAPRACYLSIPLAHMSSDIHSSVFGVRMYPSGRKDPNSRVLGVRMYS